MAKIPRFLAVSIVTFFSLLPLATIQIVSAQAVAQSYSTTSPLSAGMIVQLDTKNPSEVDAASAAELDAIHGVVVAANQASVTLSNNNAKTQQVYVATSGDYPVLVSDQNGPITAGDYVTLSSISGVGMLADSTQTIVLGKALNSFNGSSNVLSTTTLKHDGHSTTVHLGYVNVDFTVSHNPTYQPTKTVAVNNFLQKFGRTIANKDVSLFRIYLSIIVLVICSVIAGMLLYAGVRTAVSAIGRNPLARKSITRSLVQVIATSLLVFAVGITTMYLLLKL